MPAPLPSGPLVGGRPVMTFREESGRRAFLTGATLVGVGGAFAAWASSDARAFAQGSDEPGVWRAGAVTGTVSRIPAVRSASIGSCSSSCRPAPLVQR